MNNDTYKDLLPRNDDLDDMGEDFAVWLESRRLSDRDIEELARRYDAGELHGIAAHRPNPHDD